MITKTKPYQTPKMKAIRPSNQAFSLLELMIVITIIAILASASFPAYSLVQTKAKLINAVSNQKQVLTTLALYAQDNDGSYPNKDEKGTDMGTSTDVFRELMKQTGMNSEEIFYTASNDPQKSSKPNGDGYLEPEENTMVYVKGMNNSAPAGAPIIADEMETPGTYGQFHPWLEQKKAIVGYVGGQVRQEKLTTNQPGATVKGPKGSNIDDIFKTGSRDEDGRITGGLLPAYLSTDSIILP